MKRILISLIVVLLLILLTGGGLYYFRDAEWNDSYDEGNYEAIMYMLENDGMDYEGDIVVYRLTHRDGDLLLYPSNTEDIVVRLDDSKGEIEGFKAYELSGNTPIHIDMGFEFENKVLKDELLCSYLKGEYCDRDIVLNNWMISKYEEN